jgi:hypothetical protein
VGSNPDYQQNIDVQAFSYSASISLNCGAKAPDFIDLEIHHLAEQLHIDLYSLPLFPGDGMLRRVI